MAKKTQLDKWRKKSTHNTHSMGRKLRFPWYAMPYNGTNELVFWRLELRFAIHLPEKKITNYKNSVFKVFPFDFFSVSDGL